MVQAQGFSRKDMIAAIDLRPNSWKFLDGSFFGIERITTDEFWLDWRQGTTTTINPTVRGQLGTPVTLDKAHQMQFDTQHFLTYDTIKASEAAGHRVFGTKDTPVLPPSILNGYQIKHAEVHDATHHVAQIKSLFDGLVIGPDGAGGTTTRYNYYSGDHMTGITQEVKNLDLDNAATDLRGWCDEVHDFYELKAGQVDVGTPVCFLRSVDYRAFQAHPKYIEAVEREGDGVRLREANNEFVFGGIRFKKLERTYGAPDGTATAYLADQQLRIVPGGLAQFTKTIVSPAGFIEAVNRAGRMKHPNLQVLPDRRGWRYELESNFICLNKRPDLVIKGTITNT